MLSRRACASFGSSLFFMYVKYFVCRRICSTALPGKAVEQILLHTKYLTYIKNSEEPKEAQARLDNIKELLDALDHFEKNATKTISAFLDEVEFMQNQINI